MTRADAALSVEERREIYRDFVRQAEEYGYLRGWADCKYRSRFGEWPPREWRGDRVIVRELKRSRPA